MEPIKLTRSFIERLMPRDRDYDVPDAVVSGFALRVRKSGAKSFILRYRPQGMGRAANPRLITLGRYPTMTPEIAREAAQALLGSVARGADPARERKRVERRTVGEVLDDHLAHLEGRPSHRTAKYDVKLHLLPALGRIAVTELRQSDVRRMADKLIKAGKRRRAAACVTFLRAALRRAELPDEPALLKVQGWKKRKRAATLAELRAVLTAIRELLEEGSLWPWALYLFLLVVATGARPSEIRTARWADVVGAQIVRKEHKGSHETDEPRVVDLGEMGLAILERMPKVLGSPWLIPGLDVKTPLKNYFPAWKRVCQRAKVEGLWLYDLRRTWASIALGQGASAEQIARALGHSQISTTDGYAWLIPEDRQELAGRVAKVLTRLSADPTTPERG